MLLSQGPSSCSNNVMNAEMSGVLDELQFGRCSVGGVSELTSAIHFFQHNILWGAAGGLNSNAVVFAPGEGYGLTCIYQR